MRNTLVGYFDDMHEARRTQEDLIRSGFDPNTIEVVAQPAGVRTTEEEPGLWDRIKEAFGFASEEERAQYEAATRAGGALLAVTVPEEQVDPAADIIEQHHPADIEQRLGGTDEALAAAGARGSAAADDSTLEVAEEELRVGKRTVRRGGVRIHQYVTETPVEEEVRLREENATVERRRVDRPAGAGEDVFRDRDVEVTETREEPVVAKEARVVEEVRIGKEVRDTTETVRDTVRRTDVDIDRDDGKR